MSRRKAGAAGSAARPARLRLQATLGGARPLLLAGDGEPEFEYRGPDESRPVHGTAAKGGEEGAGPPVRWRLGFRVAIAVGIVAVLAAVLFWWQTASGQPQILPLGGISPGSTAPAKGEDTETGSTAVSEPPDGVDPATADASPGTVVVHVAGAVASPGVVRLPAGSRVHEAIAAAGGGLPEADLNRLNLALVVQDAQKIHVPVPGEAAPSGAAAGDAPGAAEAGSSGSKINLNTADAAELDALPKVGPVLAQRIVDWREEHGAFKSVEELDAVDGVGPKMLEALLPLVTV